MWADILSKILIPSIAAVAAVFGNQISNIIREYWAKRNSKIPLKNREVDVQIYLMLSRIRDKWDCQRVYFAKFHNGEHYVDNSEILKYTRTHEATRNGVTSERAALEKVLVSWVPEEMKLVEENGPSFRLASSFLANSHFRWLLRNAGVQAVARCKVQNHRGYIIGFVGADFDLNASCPVDIGILCSLAEDLGRM